LSWPYVVSNHLRYVNSYMNKGTIKSIEFDKLYAAIGGINWPIEEYVPSETGYNQLSDSAKATMQQMQMPAWINKKRQLRNLSHLFLLNKSKTKVKPIPLRYLLCRQRLAPCYGTSQNTLDNKLSPPIALEAFE
jgi:hypothetical protein